MQRPTGVTLIAIFQIGVGILGILGGVMVIGLGSAVAMHRAALGGAFGGVMGVLGAFLGMILLVLGVLYIVLGVGLLKLHNWARLVTLVFSAIGALLHALRLMRSMMHFMMFFAFWQALVLAICVLIIWYLLQPEVTRAFGES
jgi:hypothetical protein